MQTVRKELLLIMKPSHLMSPTKLTPDTAWQLSSSDARPPNRTTATGPKPSQKLGQPGWQAEIHAKPQKVHTEMLLIFRSGICGSLAHRKGTRQGSDIARNWTSEAHHPLFTKRDGCTDPRTAALYLLQTLGNKSFIPMDKATET